MGGRNSTVEVVARGVVEVQVALLARLQILDAVEPIAPEPEPIRHRQVRVAPAVVGHLGGEARQEFVLDAEAELPLGTPFARPIEQAVTVDVAVGLYRRWNTGFSPPALGRGETNRRTRCVQAERVAPVPLAVLTEYRRRPAADV